MKAKINKPQSAAHGKTVEIKARKGFIFTVCFEGNEKRYFFNKSEYNICIFV